MDDSHADPDLRAAALASRQHGVLSLDQLVRLGITRKMVRHRVGSGRLTPLRRGVFVVAGAPATYEQSVLSAVLAAGATAAASHLTAASLWKLLLPAPERIEVTTVLERQPRIPGVWAHRSGLLLDLDRSALRRIPLHTVERTLCDLSGRLAPDALGKGLDDALRRRLTTLTRVWRVHERLPLAPGRAPKRLERVLIARTPATSMMESALEDRVFEVIRAAGLPLPIPQHQIVLAGRTRRIDFAYPDERIAIEVDGFEFHAPRQVFDDDRMRGNEVALAGFTPLHFTSTTTDEQIVEHVTRALHRAFVQKVPA